MARIPYLDPDRAPESVKRLLAPDRPQKIALLFGHAESNWPRLADLLLSILGEQELESRLRELGILRLGRASERQRDRRGNQYSIEHVCSPLNARMNTAAKSSGCGRTGSEEGRGTSGKRCAERSRINTADASTSNA